jgi:hypothetical protein
MHKVMFVAEQPSSSLFELHPRWAQLTNVLGAAMTRLHLWMESYGGGSAKVIVVSETYHVSSLAGGFDV